MKREQMEVSALAITLGYRGCDFHGFARQAGGVRTVQGELERALETLAGKPIATVCAGRTDAGVHAQGQVVSCEMKSEHLSAGFLRSLDALTPPDISIHEVRTALAGFSARFDATARTYRYLIANEPTPPLFCTPFAWHIPRSLNLLAMLEAAAHFLGEHDFASFCTTATADELHAKDLSTCRNIIELSIKEITELGENLIAITVTGNAFLHSQVRSMVGTLVEIGLGKREPASIPEILAARTRTAAGQTAPAHGLTLVHVRY